MRFGRRNEHGKECAGPVVDTAPADSEGFVPLRAIVEQQATAASDARVVEEQMNVIRIVGARDVVAERMDLRLVGYIREERRDTSAARSLCLAKRLRLCHRLLRHVTHRNVSAFRAELSCELSSHSRSAPCDNSNP